MMSGIGIPRCYIFCTGSLLLWNVGLEARALYNWLHGCSFRSGTEVPSRVLARLMLLYEWIHRVHVPSSCNTQSPKSGYNNTFKALTCTMKLLEAFGKLRARI